MSDRNDILSKGWNKNRRIGMNIVTFAMFFAMVLVTLGGLGCIGGDDGGADANTDGDSTDSGAGEGQSDSPSMKDQATITKALEEMESREYKNPEFDPKYYPEGHFIQFVPINNLPSKILFKENDVSINNLRIEGNYLKGILVTEKAIKGKIMFNLIGKDGYPIRAPMMEFAHSNEKDNKLYMKPSVGFTLRTKQEANFRVELEKGTEIVHIQRY